MNIKSLTTLLAATLMAAPSAVAQPNLTQYVDPRIGTGDHGHVFVGANVPFGMVDAGPTQLETGWDWCSGYHESGTKIVGFAQTHLSGTGCGDLGDVAILPCTEQQHISLTSQNGPRREDLATPYCHANEEVRPGYYSVLLGSDQPADSVQAAKLIRVEVTASLRYATYRITFPQGAKRNRLIIDLKNGAGGDRTLSARISPLSGDRNTYVGYRISHGWANEQHCYFAIRFSRPAPTGTIAPGGQFREFNFTPSTEPLIVNVALSPVSEMNALESLPGRQDFNRDRKLADQAWNRELSRIQASFASERDRRIFYTAMYHFMVAPQVWDDWNGDWRGADNKIYRAAKQRPAPAFYDIVDMAFPFIAPPTPDSGDGLYLTTLSLWDTYRAAAPLSTIILPDLMPSVASTYLRIFREQGKLPVWHLMSQETDCMVGCPAVPILADLLLKGYVRDSLQAWNAMYRSLTMDERGLDDMKRYGYVANDHHGEGLSRSLEYMLADWSAAQAGKAIIAAGKGTEAVLKGTEYLERRARGYINLYDERVGFLRSKNSEGQFNPIEGFNPAYQTKDYTEGNPWQYLWLVPHDVPGLISLLGGKDTFVRRLDDLFNASSELNAEANPDISGLIGQYAHGNEPSHHIAYLYAMAGQPKQTARIVRRILRELYTDQPAGLCGNEDVGQMSAWYILSALGFYQVEPCGGRYIIGSPLVKEAVLQVADGKTFTIRTHGGSDKAIYVKKAVLNGKPITDGVLHHEDIVRGGTLDFYMGR